MSASAGRVLLIPKGDYDETATYSPLDWIRYERKTYVCKQTATGKLPTNTAYWQVLAEDGLNADAEALVKDTVGWTGKNLLKNTAITQTVNGITFTVNADGSVTINGTATRIANINFTGAMTSDKELIFSLGANSSNTTFKGFITAADSTGDIANTGDSGSVKFTTSKSFFCHMVVYAGATLSNVTVYPMLRDASITDPTYEPYHESVEEEIEQIYADNGVLGAKNLLPYPYKFSSTTINGITWTVNSDGTLTANGTSTDSSTFQLFGAWASTTVIIPSGRYILSTSIVHDNVHFRCSYGSTQLADVRREGVVDAPQGLSYAVVAIDSGVTVSNLTIKPMIRLASDPDDTYQPYAMTNRELTEKKIDAELTFVTGVSIDTLTENKRYYCSRGMTGLPTGNIGYLDVHRSPAGEGIHQTFYPAGTQGEIYVRRYWDNAWGSWYKFAGTIVS